MKNCDKCKGTGKIKQKKKKKKPMLDHWFVDVDSGYNNVSYDLRKCIKETAGASKSKIGAIKLFFYNMLYDELMEMAPLTKEEEDELIELESFLTKNTVRNSNLGVEDFGVDTLYKRK